MKIIVAGDGDTGSYLAQMLSVESQDVILIGYDRVHLAELDTLGNFITFEGNPLSRSDLMECGADRADLFVAVTPDETVNIVSCQIAKDCGAKKCVARVDMPEFDDDTCRSLFTRSGIDHTIYPEKLAALEIRQFIECNWACERFGICGGALDVVGVRMRAGGTMCGKSLNEAPGNPRRFHVVAIKRGGRVIIPGGSDRLLEGDTIYFSVIPEFMQFIPSICGWERINVKRVMISGAGHVTENVIELISRRYDITVIDPDRERCNVIAARFPNVTVVNAKVNDMDALAEEGIAGCDVFLALTGSSETNIVSCMVARALGARRTVARIEQLQYVSEAESLSIDKIINKKLINAGKVFSELIDSSHSSAQCVSLGYAEIAGIRAAEGSRITSDRVANLSLPRNFTLGGVIRGDKGMLVEGSTMILPGDYVAVFYMPGALNKVTRYFKPPRKGL